MFLQELQLIGEFGLRNKREVWRVKYTLAKIRKAARTLLTLEEKVIAIFCKYGNKSFHKRMHE